MSVQFLQVVEEEEGDDAIELPTEEDGTLLLSTLVAQFPTALGIKYRATPESKTFRGVRLCDGRLHPPIDGGWESKVFICSFPKENKRKIDDTVESSASSSKIKRLETKAKCTDLIVLGLPWSTTETELKEYFENFGDILVTQLKRNKDGHSKGYGFIRFARYESQMKVLAKRHLIGGRWCDVKIPNSKDGFVEQLQCRVFVGKCTEDMTVEDLKEYFKKFGEITDVFIPKPFRAFCFVTFIDPEVAQSLCGENHIIKGVEVYVSNAAPRYIRKRNDERGTRKPSRQIWEGESSRGGGNNTYSNSSPNQNWGDGVGNTVIPNFSPLLNPALMAAALNQAGWNFMNNMRNQDNSNYQNNDRSGPLYNAHGYNNADKPKWSERRENRNR